MTLKLENFDALKLSLASPETILSWSHGEVTKPETINYRTLKPERDGLFCERIFGPTRDWECYCGKYKRVRYKGIICERCGVEVTRQKGRRERMGHIDLAAPVSHIWFFKGVPSRIGYLLDIAPRELEKVLYFAASIVTAVDVEKRAGDVNALEDQVKAESERIYVDRDEALAALEDRLARRREYFAKGRERNFDEDDDFWGRGLSNWAEEQALPTLEDVRGLVSGLFVELVGQITTEDSKKIRELVRNAAIRDDRRLAPRELEQVSTAAEQILAAIAPLEKQLDKATGAKKGAITKHLHRIVDGLLAGDELNEEDAGIASGVDAKNLEKARELGKGLLADVLDSAEPDSDIRELTNDLCLRTDGRIQKEDLDAIIQWALKVREMYLDIESRREDAREAAVDSVRRLEQTWQLFRDLEPKLIVNDEQIFRELKDRFGSPYGFGVYFRGGMGAEAIRDLLKDLDLTAESAILREQIRTGKGQKQQRAIKRLKVVSAFLTSENKPEGMILEAVPVIPPELRPMVQLDGGRFATSDLNDLYRRVINRHNLLKKLMDLHAPEVIVRNEKRMLQEAVDALFDNGRRGRVLRGANNRPLKSLSDTLKGKQGRFRQNLLGKRVDYSGRSVIVVGPELKLHQCGLPKKMALELFKPFIYHRLEQRGHCTTIKQAKELVEQQDAVVWDILEEVIKDHPILLNRAPTLHRLGIQPFEPVLVEGKAIKLHPLTCTAFNADFDGDQMAVHIPLSPEAQIEASTLMLASNNILSPAHGGPIAIPTQDMVLGLYYLTKSRPGTKGEGRTFASGDDVLIALEMGEVETLTPIKLRHTGRVIDLIKAFDSQNVLHTEPIEFVKQYMDTTVGRVILNDVLPDEMPFINGLLKKKGLTQLVQYCYLKFGLPVTVAMLDEVKALGFLYATRAGISIGIDDMIVPGEKAGLVKDAEKAVIEVQSQYQEGAITHGERYNKIIEIWSKVTERVSEEMFKTMEEDDRTGRYLNPIYIMADSGARGSKQQIRQLSGMRGLMAKPSGEIIEQPITANFREGLDVLQYFISTHGARKGLADTALKTADSGYLTRRLCDVAQDVIVTEDDCGTGDGIYVEPIIESGEIIEPLRDRIVGRVALEDQFDYEGNLIVGLNREITEDLAGAIQTAGIERVKIRSVLTCESKRGVCQLCYGRNLATGRMVERGEAVGIISAQSIGEPGTQLTMRTFHIGGAATGSAEQSKQDAKSDGFVRFINVTTVKNAKGELIAMNRNGIIAIIDEKGREKERYPVVYGAKILFADGAKAETNDILLGWDPYTFP